MQRLCQLIGRGKRREGEGRIRKGEKIEKKSDKSKSKKKSNIYIEEKEAKS